MEKSFSFKVTHTKKQDEILKKEKETSKVHCFSFIAAYTQAVSEY